MKKLMTENLKSANEIKVYFHRNEILADDVHLSHQFSVDITTVSIHYHVSNYLDVINPSGVANLQSHNGILEIQYPFNLFFSYRNFNLVFY